MDTTPISTRILRFVFSLAIFGISYLPIFTVGIPWWVGAPMLLIIDFVPLLGAVLDVAVWSWAFFTVLKLPYTYFSLFFYFFFSLKCLDLLQVIIIYLFEEFPQFRRFCNDHFIGIVIGLVIIGFLFFASNPSFFSLPSPTASQAPTSPAPSPSPAPAPEPQSSIVETTQPAKSSDPILISQPRPRNGQLIATPTSPQVAPFTVETKGDEDYLIVLTSSKSNYTVMSFYVRGGETATVDVPLGNYRVYYAIGTTWYGIFQKFGPDASYYKCDDLFRFSKSGNYYNGWTLTLYPVADGNMEKVPVSPEDFPK